ncbi:hypothetical protein CRE_14972 [Caenorhabditis remanei]|uniref:SET domain-containing protein n=1 Tax=Caenorhabditis remanei TaxID=31234 RepID=E3NF02_CAERE|nr:hypothetical protein CRE_14972 [Caenorhabditis remanei]
MFNSQPLPQMSGQQTLQSCISSFTTFPHKNTYSSAAYNLLKTQIPTNTDVLLFQTRCRRRAKKKKNRVGLIAAEPIQKSQIVLEMNGQVALSEEFPAKHGKQGCFKYDGVSATSENGSKKLFLLDTNQNRNQEKDAMYTRRSCKPNCVLKHIISRHEPIGILILANQHIVCDEEITLPFDVDWLESRDPLPCVKHEKNMRECGLEMRRRMEEEKRQKIADELAEKRADPRYFMAGEFRRVQEIFRRRKTEEEESGEMATTSDAVVVATTATKTLAKQQRQTPPKPMIAWKPPSQPFQNQKKRPNHYSPTALTYLKTIPRLHKNLVLDPKSLKNAFRMYSKKDDLETLVTSETIDPSGILLEINGFISMANEVKRVPGDGTLIYGGLDKTQKLICIDTKTHNNDARVIRRSCFPNATIYHVTDDSELLRIVLVPTRVLKKGTEITLAFDFDSRHSEVPIECATHKNSMHLCSFENERKRHLEKKECKRRAAECGNSELEGTTPKRKMEETPESSESSERLLENLQKIAIDTPPGSKPTFKIPPQRLSRRNSFPVTNPTSSAMSGILKDLTPSESEKTPPIPILSPQKPTESTSFTKQESKEKLLPIGIENLAPESPPNDPGPGDVLTMDSESPTSSDSVKISVPSVPSETPTSSDASEAPTPSATPSEVSTIPILVAPSDIPTISDEIATEETENGDFESNDIAKTPPPPPSSSHRSADSTADDDDTDEISDEDENEAESSWEMRCHCCMPHECGNTIECDSCKTWQHMACMGLTEKSDVSNYLCEVCQPRKLPMNKTAAVKLQRQILKGLKASTSRKGDKKKKKKRRTGMVVQKTPECQKTKGNSEGVASLLNSLSTTSSAESLLKEARLHRKAKRSSDNDEILKATCDVKVGDVILEVSGYLSKPEEVKRKAGGVAGIFMYHGLAIGDSGDSEGVLCISTRKNGISANVRRSCAPNSALKHVVDAENQLKFIVIATEEIARGHEITLPFDADWRESRIPLKCARHLKNLGECPLKKERRRVAAERRKSDPEEKTMKRRRVESGEEGSSSSAKRFKIKPMPIRHSTPHPSILPPSLEQEDQIQQNQYSPKVVKILRTIPPFHLESPYLNASGYSQKARSDSDEILKTSCPVSPRKVIMEMTGFISTPSEVERGDGVFVYDGLMKEGIDKNSPDSLLCIDTKRGGNEAKLIRRSCAPNSILKHVVGTESIEILVVASEQMDEGTEVKLPFDVDFVERGEPLKCVEHEKNMSECPMEMRRISGRKRGGQDMRMDFENEVYLQSITLTTAHHENLTQQFQNPDFRVRNSKSGTKVSESENLTLPIQNPDFRI